VDALVQLNAALSGRYVVEREIGAGGMATVYLARDARHRRNVALKVLNPELGAVLGAERFLSEIQVTANLQHPNLLPLFDSGEADGLLFYVMPFVEGESLRVRLDRETQLPVDEAIRLAAAVASALDYAHRHGVIHRDLKPENILLHDGQPLVADFGIALAVSNAAGARITQTGLSLGTPQYMSPEQATGDRAIDARTDVYSLGAVLYEMLTGEPPHTGATMQAIIARVLTEKPRGVRAVRPSVPEDTANAVDRALEKLPADRWRTAREFCEALQGTRPVAVRADGALPQSSGLAERRLTPASRARDPVVLSALAVGVAGLWAGIWAWNRAPIDVDRTAVRFTIAPTTPGQEITSTSQVAISPDGKVVAYVVQDGTGRQRLTLREMSRLDERAISGTGPANTPFFSPDGAWVGLVAAGRRGVLKVAVAGGAVTTIAEGSTIRGATWARADLIVASVRDTLVTVAAAGGKFLPLRGGFPEGQLGERSPHALDDGETLLYQSWRGSFAESRIGVASIRTGKREILDLTGASPIGVVDGYLIYGTSTGAIMAVPFDVGRRRITGASIPVISDSENVVSGGLVRAAVSRTGSLVYTAGRRTSQVVLADMTGHERVLLAEPRDYDFPRFSPDGTRLAFSVRSIDGSDIWTYDIASGIPTKLTTGTAGNCCPEWTPDGKRVLYTSNRLGVNSLWWQNADLSGTAELVQRAPETVNAGVFSPDGRILMYWLSTPQYPADIFYRQLAGDTTSKPLAATPSAELTPRFSPDGKWVAYAYGQDNNPLQVYVQPFPPTGARYPVTADGGTQPVWSRDGRRIFYVSNNRLAAATIQRVPTFAVTSRDSMFSGDYLLSAPTHANYDTSPDSNRFVLLRAGGTPTRIVVVQDWRYELRQRILAARKK
jgi:serine/threonine-protein kinase